MRYVVFQTRMRSLWCGFLSEVSSSSMLCERTAKALAQRMRGCEAKRSWNVNISGTEGEFN